MRSSSRCRRSAVNCHAVAAARGHSGWGRVPRRSLQVGGGPADAREPSVEVWRDCSGIAILNGRTGANAHMHVGAASTWLPPFNARPQRRALRSLVASRTRR
jgi:hypothetical protein